MQLTNGAIKVGVQPPPLNPTAVEEYEGVDLNTFDLSAFAKPAKVRTASAAGTDVLSNNPEVQKFLTEGAELFKLGERYEVEIVQRGHNALYELLASIYDFSMRIENSSFKEKILTEIRKDLKDNHSITIKSNTPAINTMVKYMVRAIHSDASYLSEPKSRSRAGGHMFMAGHDKIPINNGAVLNISQIIRAVVSSAAEAELGALFINAKNFAKNA